MSDHESDFARAPMCGHGQPADAPPPVPSWLWALPFLLLAWTAPLWLHVWEPTLFLALNRACANVVAPVWTGLSLLGNAWGILGATAPLLVLSPRLLWAWLCAAPFVVLFARLGKGVIESPRPAAVVENLQMRIVGETLHNVSMPSGHTLTAFACATALWFSLPAVKRARHSWLLVLAALTGLSRIAVGAHWPGDVAVGAALGLLAGLLGSRWSTRIAAYHLQPRSWSLRAVAALLAVAATMLIVEAQDFDENLPMQRILAVTVLLTLAWFVGLNIRPTAKTLSNR